MADLSQFSSCVAYLESQSRHPFPDYAKHIRRPAVTISRQVGARGSTIGRKLHDALNSEIGEPSAGWTLLDRNLMTRILEDNDLPKRLARHFPEDRARRRYLKHHFQRDIDDPTLYDLAINTDRFSDELVVQLIENMVAEKRKMLARKT